MAAPSDVAFWALMVVTSSLMLSLSQATDDDEAMTAFCCWPLQFQSRLGRFNGAPVGGSPDIFEEEMLLSYDWPFKRWGFWIREKYVTNDYVEVIYFEDYQARKATIGSVQGCVTIPLPEWAQMRHPCIPSDAHFVETAWLGDRVLPYDVWQWTEREYDGRNGVWVNATVSSSVSHDWCKPVSETSWWTAQNFNYTANIGFLTMHIGETDGLTDEPMADLRRWYDCKEYDEMPKNFDIRHDAFADEIHLINRIRKPPSAPGTPPPRVG